MDNNRKGEEKQSYMILKNDNPYKAQDDGWFSINNVRNVYVN